MYHYKEMLSHLAENRLLRSLQQSQLEPGHLPHLKGKGLLLFSSNNYLGLSHHPLLKNAAIEAINAWGIGSGASRLVCGNNILYTRLEEKLARLKQTEAALVFSTGYLANTGTLAAITKKGDLILADRLNHASLIEGSRLSGATLRVYRHRDMTHLQTLLSKSKKGQRIFIVTDGIFSMDGDIAPLPDIIQLAERFDAMVYLDDAHATGVIGENGGGTASHYNLSSPRLIQMGTLSKALGGLGGFIAGSHDLIQYLINNARPLIYTTALPPATLAAAISALDLIHQDTALIERLWENRDYFYQKITALGFNTLESETPIVPIVLGDSQKALIFSERLLKEGLHVPAIRPPTVPQKTARLRVTLSATHTKAHIDTLTDHLKKIGQTLGVI